MDDLLLRERERRVGGGGDDHLADKVMGRRGGPRWDDTLTNWRFTEYLFYLQMGCVLHGLGLLTDLTKIGLCLVFFFFSFTTVAFSQIFITSFSHPICDLEGVLFTGWAGYLSSAYAKWEWSTWVDEAKDNGRQGLDAGGFS